MELNKDLHKEYLDIIAERKALLAEHTTILERSALISKRMKELDLLYCKVETKIHNALRGE